MFSQPEVVIFLLCCGGYLYSVYYCLEKYLEDNSISNTRYGGFRVDIKIPIYSTSK